MKVPSFLLLDSSKHIIDVLLKLMLQCPLDSDWSPVMGDEVAIGSAAAIYPRSLYPKDTVFAKNGSKLK